MPPAAIQTYEALRAGVLSGQSRPEGLGVVLYHGMVRGLAVMLSAVVPSRSAADRSEPLSSAGPPERQFVRLLANMLLQTHSEAMHVY